MYDEQETQKSFCEAIEAQPIIDQRGSVLGEDLDGSRYVHFPQFCGSDLRIYKQRSFKLAEEDAADDQQTRKVGIYLSFLLFKAFFGYR